MPFYTDFVPSAEGDLVAFLENFATRATAEAASIGLTPAQCTSLSADVASFKASWLLTRDRSTRSGAKVIEKNEEKKAVVKNLRDLAKIVQAYPGTTDAQRDLLGLTVPAQRQKRPIPATAPLVEKTGVTGNVVGIKLREANSTRRGRPKFCSSAQVYSYVGENPPTNVRDWFFEGSTNRLSLDLAFDTTLPVGTKVWICAAWANERNQAGPASEAIGAVLVGGSVLPTAAQNGGGNLSLAA